MDFTKIFDNQTVSVSDNHTISIRSQAPTYVFAPDIPAGVVSSAGQPMGLLLALTYAA